MASADKLASFRINADLWEDFQSFAKEKGFSASALLVNYIQSVVGTGTNTSSLNALSPRSAERLIDSKIEAAMVDIEKLIDEKIKEAILVDTLRSKDAGILKISQS